MRIFLISVLNLFLVLPGLGGCQKKKASSNKVPKAAPAPHVAGCRRIATARGLWWTR